MRDLRDQQQAQTARLAQQVEEQGAQGVTRKQVRMIKAYVKKNAANLTACQHLVKIHRRIDHPKYGSKVPHFETAEVPDVMQCPCEEAQRVRQQVLDAVDEG